MTASPGPRVLGSRPWADRVFHVLAHVPSPPALPASVYDRAYVAFVEQHLGPARDRPLGEDAVVLARTLVTHEHLASAQLLAWLFADEVRAGACMTRDLADLREEDVDLPAALPQLRALGPAAEVLRCAVHLEAEAHARLPTTSIDAAGVARSLGELVVVAPDLARHDVALVRALRLRGRVLGGEIWIGAPGPAPWPSIEHVTWQAAHEATVAEVSRELPLDVTHERLERTALERLQQRVKTARLGLDGAHRRWRDHLAAGWR